VISFWETVLDCSRGMDMGFTGWYSLKSTRYTWAVDLILTFSQSPESELTALPNSAIKLTQDFDKVQVSYT
jgi:hypothetical protein